MLTQVRRNCAVGLKSNRLMSCLSLSTMCLLVLASIVIITIISVTPIIILSLGELQEGQRDLILLPKQNYFNSSKVEALTSLPVMPRIHAKVNLNSMIPANAWLMDFAKEKANHLGTIGGDQGDNHSYVYLHASLGVSEGSQIRVNLQDRSIFRALQATISNGHHKVANSAEITEELNMILEPTENVEGKFTVRRIFSDASGKFGIGTTNNFVYMDIRWALQQIINQTYQTQGINKQNSSLVRLLNGDFSFGEFSTQATINMLDRVKVYSNPDYEETYTQLSKFAQAISGSIGLFALETNMPIASNLVTLGYVGMFIGVMLKLVIVSLFLLSVIMMNNMLLMGVQRKNFDFALLKVMGADRLFVIVNLLSGALKYVAFANIIAYPLAYFTLQGVTGVFESFFGYKYQITPTPQAIIGGIIIGILVPIISAIAPIWGVITNDLVQNLNPIRNKTQAIRTEVYVEGKEFPYGKLTFGLLATSYGLMNYYLLPKGLINQNIGLLLFVFFVILQGLLIGLILLSYSFQYILEKAVAYLALFWANSTDFLLTIKNLSSHRFKNRRSSILYALSVSFIIFVSVGLQIQVDTIYNQLLKQKGCYVQVKGLIDTQMYNNILKTIPGVQDWAYETYPLKHMLNYQGVKEIMISDKARLFFAKNDVIGVSPNLINTFYFDEVSVYSTDAKTPYDPYSYLYSPQGFMTCTLSQYIARKFNILDSQNRQFLLNYYYADSVKRVPINYSSVFDKRIGLLYSSILPMSEIGVSFDTFRVLAGIPATDQIPIQIIKVKLTDPGDAAKVADLIRRKNQGIDAVWDYSQLKNTIDRIRNLLDQVLLILLAVVLVISFFSLVTTTYVNILDQTNEIGILMILGYSKSRIVRIYIYESFVLVVNSCIIGVAVGYFVAWMMGLQRQLFSDLPVSIKINGIPIIIMAAIFSSLLSTYQPLKQVFGNTISQIMNYAK